MNLHDEFMFLFGRLQRLLDVGRVGAARGLVESLKRSHGPTVWVELRNRLHIATTWAQNAAGVAWFPVETQAPTDGRNGGLVRVHVSFESPQGDALPSRNRETWRAALALGLRMAGSQTPADEVRVTFHPDIGGGHWLRVEGRSAELALAVAAYSAAAGEAVSDGVAFTGAVDVDTTGADATIEAPEALSVSAKLECLRDDWSPDARLVTGPGARPDVQSFSRVRALTTALFSERSSARAAAATVDPLRELADAERAGRYSEGMGIAEQLWAERDRLPRAADAFRVALEGIRLSNHLALEKQFELWRARAREVKGHAEPAQAAAWSANLAVREIDSGRPETAVDMLEPALTALPLRSSPDLERVYLLGTLARGFSAIGDHDRAIELGDLAVAFAPFAERPRNTGDAALWRLRAGLASEALETLDAGEADLEAVAQEYDVALTRGFRALTRTRALIALGRLDEARDARFEVLRAPPNSVLVLGAAETGLAFDIPIDASLEALDLTHPVVSRLRARIEFARPDGDLAAAQRWARGFTPEELHLRVPY